LGGVGYFNMLCKGDSLTACHLALPSPDKVGWPAQTASLLRTSGVPSGGTGWAFPYNGSGVTPDSRWTLAGGFVAFGATTQFVYASASGATATFVSDQPGTIVDVAYLDSGGPFTVKVDGTTVGTITPGTTNTVQVHSYTGQTNATHTVTITTTSATATYCLAVRVRATTSGLMVSNAGLGGNQAGQWLPTDPTFYNPGPMLASLAAASQPWDLVFLQFMLNDMGNGVTPAVFQANMTAIAAADLANGADVVLGIEPFPVTSTFTAAQMQPYRQAVYNIADSLGIPLVDFGDVIGPYNTALANGLRGDTLHLNGGGYSLEARVVADLILAS
jgi:lysophospholipase L1-like esterase